MIVVKTHDKRYTHGFNMHYFHTDTVTKEVIEFVKKNTKVYNVMCKDKTYFSREEFLEEYGQKQGD